MDDSPDLKLRTGDALLVIDVQRDFLPGQPLEVPRGDEVIAPLNDYLRLFVARGLPVFASRDWHPPDHCSFESHGGQWASHCVRDTPGAEFAPGLNLPADKHVISKATTAGRDAYSAFSGTDLEGHLKELGIKRLFVGGLATDYCVLETVRDAIKHDYQVLLLADAIRGIDPAKNRQAIDEMLKHATEVRFPDLARANR
jgi:nicotinamidase/pyrazinamidase